ALLLAGDADLVRPRTGKAWLPGKKYNRKMEPQLLINEAEPAHRWFWCMARLAGAGAGPFCRNWRSSLPSMLLTGVDGARAVTPRTTQSSVSSRTLPPWWIRLAMASIC